MLFYIVLLEAYGDTWHVLTLPNARHAGLRLGTCMQPSKWFLPPTSCGSRGEEVQSGVSPPPRPPGVSPGGPLSAWIEGGEMLILTPAPWMGMQSGEAAPGQECKGATGQAEPILGEWVGGGTRQALLSHHLHLQKTDSKIKGRIPRRQPQALNSRHGVF